jgi:hypothetical protein
VVWVRYAQKVPTAVAVALGWGVRTSVAAVMSKKPVEFMNQCMNC